MTREDVYAAFFALSQPLIDDSTFTSASRRLLLVETLDPSRFPAFFQQEVGEQRATYTQSGVQFWIFEASWYVYCYQPNQTDPMTPALNALVQRVADLLTAGDNDSTFWVGDQRIAIQHERTVIWEGVLADRAVARLDFTLKPISV